MSGSRRLFNVTSDSQLNDIAFDSKGNMYITGRYRVSSNQVLFNLDGTPSSLILPSTNSGTISSRGNMYLCKYNPDGQILAYTVFRLRESMGNSLYINSLDQVILVGRFHCNAHPDNGTYITNIIYHLDNNDITSSAKASSRRIQVFTDYNDDTHWQSFMIIWNSNGTCIRHANWSNISADRAYDSCEYIFPAENDDFYILDNRRGATGGANPFPDGMGGGRDRALIKRIPNGWVQYGINSGWRASTFEGPTSYPSGHNLANTSAERLIQTISGLVDGDGNVYMVGNIARVETQTIFDIKGTKERTDSGYTMPGSGSHTRRQTILVKWDSAGNFLGQTNLSSTSDNRAYSIARDSENNIYVCGFYSSTSNVVIKNIRKSSTIEETNPQRTLQGGNNNNMYLIKWNKDGDYVSHCILRGSGDDRGWSVSVDKYDNVYVVGQYNNGTTSTLTIPKIKQTTTNSMYSLPATNNVTNAFIIKWDKNGEVLSFSSIQGSALSLAKVTRINQNTDNIYVGGWNRSSTNTPIYNLGAQNDFSQREVQYNLLSSSVNSPFIIEIMGSSNLLNVPSDYSTIQSAINASLTEGDTIQLAPGSYSENLTINKSVNIVGSNRETCILQPLSNTTATMVITDNSSGTSIKNLTVKGQFTTQTTTGNGNTNNNNSAILFLNTNTTINLPIINIRLENLIVKSGSFGIAFNNKHSNNITIKDCVIENNEGSGIHIATNTETMNGFNVRGCTIRNNNLNAISTNPSGSFRPNCTNFSIKDCVIENNNLLTIDDSHDLSFFGFNGNIEIKNTTVHSNHLESKEINGSSAALGGWGLIIYGSESDTLPNGNSGNITLENLTLTGNVIKSGVGIDRYANLGNIVMNNVNMKDYEPNGAGQTWVQFVIGHRDNTKSFNIGNTELKTLALSNIGDVNARQAKLYNNSTGNTLSRTTIQDILQIVSQITDKLNIQGLGEVSFVPFKFNNNDTYIGANEPNGIINAILETQNDTTLNLLPGTYFIDTLSTTSNRITLKSISSNDVVVLKYQ
jgi:hypothetical protein